MMISLYFITTIAIMQVLMYLWLKYLISKIKKKIDEVNLKIVKLENDFRHTQSIDFALNSRLNQLQNSQFAVKLSK